MAKIKNVSKPAVPVTDEANKVRIGIVGHGFVGQAVDFAFTHHNVTQFHVDPKYDTTLDDLIEWGPHFVFVCAPTPMSDDGFVDASIVEDATLKLLEHTKAMVIIKSTITPDIVDRLYNSLFEDDIFRLFYNPEFLTESSAKRDFVEAPFHVIGCMPQASAKIIELYSLFSQCKNGDFVILSPPEAAFVKYAINSFLALKVTFFNQLYDSSRAFGVNWHTLSRTVGRDPRVGHGHTVVPGFDGKRGFGGACFPKDALALTKFDKENFSLIEKMIEINNEYRQDYDKDEREIEQNVNYGQTEEELEDKND